MITVKVLSDLEQKARDYALEALARDIEPGEDPILKYGEARGVIKGIEMARNHIAQLLEEEEQRDV